MAGLLTEYFRYSNVQYSDSHCITLSIWVNFRSAALYHLSHYPECLADIDLALKYRYPKNLEYKLHQRKGQSLNKIGKHSEAIRLEDLTCPY